MRVSEDGTLRFDGARQMTADHSHMKRRVTEKADGRYLVYYRFGDEAEACTMCSWHAWLGPEQP